MSAMYVRFAASAPPGTSHLSAALHGPIAISALQNLVASEWRVFVKGVVYQGKVSFGQRLQMNALPGYWCSLLPEAATASKAD